MSTPQKFNDEGIAIAGGAAIGIMHGIKGFVQNREARKAASRNGEFGVGHGINASDLGKLFRVVGDEDRKTAASTAQNERDNISHITGGFEPGTKAAYQTGNTSANGTVKKAEKTSSTRRRTPTPKPEPVVEAPAVTTKPKTSTKTTAAATGKPAAKLPVVKPAAAKKTPGAKK